MEEDGSEAGTLSAVERARGFAGGKQRSARTPVAWVLADQAAAYA